MIKTQFLKTDDIELRPYKAEDGIELYERLGAKDNLSDIRRWAEDVESDIAALTVVYEGRIVACAGITKILEGVGQAWAIFPPDVGKHHIDPRITKVKIRELMEEHNLRRVQATARTDYPAASSYLKYLGFEREGVMKSYEPDGADSYLYAITR